MQRDEYTRKLAALLSADVKGYSRLMEDDDVSTVKTIRAYRTAIEGLVARYRGRVVDTPGDNILAQFASAFDAVRCAVDIQEELKIRNALLPDSRKMEFRIGINVGDIIEEGGRIYGDGVNIAARIEGLAEGGGICISRSTYEYVKSKLTILNEYIGEHSVKNIAQPIGVYKLIPNGSGQENDSGISGSGMRPSGRTKSRFVLYASLVAALMVTGLLIWNKWDPPDESGPAKERYRITFDRPGMKTPAWEAYPENVVLRVVPAFAKDGLKSPCLEATLPVADYPGIFNCQLPGDWTGYRQFAVDVFLSGSPGDGENFGVRIDDHETTSYRTRFNGDYRIVSGLNQITIPLEQITASIDISRITCLYLFIEKPATPRTLCFDNIRLE